jgi:hypothetical protein
VTGHLVAVTYSPGICAPVDVEYAKHVTQVEYEVYRKRRNVMRKQRNLKFQITRRVIYRSPEITPDFMPV